MTTDIKGDTAIDRLHYWYLYGRESNLTLARHEVAALLDEIERLRAIVREMSGGLCAIPGRTPEQLQMDCIRLRAALQTIAGTSKFKPPPVEEMIDIAAVALAGHGEHK